MQVTHGTYAIGASKRNRPTLRAKFYFSASTILEHRRGLYSRQIMKQLEIRKFLSNFGYP
jgi:hypothetical protein